MGCMRFELRRSWLLRPLMHHIEEDGGGSEAQQAGKMILHNMYVSIQANISRNVSFGGFLDGEMMNSALPR